MNSPILLLFSNTHAMLLARARAMNPCLVAFGPVHLAQPNVRGVPTGKPPSGKTFAVIRDSMDASKYLGASATSISGVLRFG